MSAQILQCIPVHLVFCFPTQLNRDLDHCHHQMKHLNTLLTEKKESVLSYQDKITNMRAELAELRDYAITSGRRQEAQV